MRIQHNIMAMNAYRNYNTNSSALSKNLEKLSSGYKINRAGDDAAGLAISQKMRAQITGLQTAQANAKDGVSLVQTAEGAMTEVHDMLNRMVELANKSANGTFDNETDRANLQKEVQQLKSEIDRIADSSNFNGIKLLDGSMDAKGVVGGGKIDVAFDSIETATAAQSMVKPEFSINLDGLEITANSTAAQSITVSFGGKQITLKSSSVNKGTKLTASKFKLTATNTLTIGGLQYKAAKDQAGKGITFTLVDGEESKLSNDVTLNPSFSVSVTPKGTASISSGIYNTGTQVISSGRPAKGAEVAKVEFTLTADMLKNGSTIKIGDQTFTIDFTKTSEETKDDNSVIGVKDYLNNGKVDAKHINDVASAITKAAGKTNAYFNVGNTGDGKLVITSKDSLKTATIASAGLDTEEGLKAQISVSIPEVKGKALTLQIGDTSDGFNQLSVSVQDMHAKSLGIDTVDIGTQEGAKAAVDAIKNAINTVSSVRGTLGATQNRLDHTMNNLSVMTENIQDAEATIRDTDVADEMMKYTKNNILIQSAQAMLAQANQVPQGVLQLLQ